MSKSPSHHAPTRRLPQHPNLEQLRKQAKDLLEQYRSGDSAAIAEIQNFERNPDPSTFALYDAQVNGTFCLGYVTGVVDDHFSCQINEPSSTAALDRKKHFCLPDGVTPNQTVRVIAKCSKTILPGCTKAPSSL